VQYHIQALTEAIQHEEAQAAMFGTLLASLPKEVAADFVDESKRKVKTLQSELDRWRACVDDPALTLERVAAVQAELAAQYRECAGHRYAARKFPQPVHCCVCCQLLHMNQGFECVSTCRWWREVRRKRTKHRLTIR